MNRSCAATLVLALACLAEPALAKPFDAAAMERWAKTETVHYEAVGEVTDKHVQIPPKDADLYGDVVERVTLSFDWNKNTQELVGAVTFKNLPAKVTNIVSIDAKCPPGKLNGAYEHFDIVEVKQAQPGAVELVGKRIHPDTLVAQACSANLTPFKGGETPRSEYIGPPDPSMLALGDMIPPDSPVKISPDGKSLVMKALNNNWVWTFTPTAK